MKKTEVLFTTENPEDLRFLFQIFPAYPKGPFVHKSIKELGLRAKKLKRSLKRNFQTSIFINTQATAEVKAECSSVEWSRATTDCIVISFFGGIAVPVLMTGDIEDFVEECLKNVKFKAGQKTQFLLELMSEYKQNFLRGFIWEGAMAIAQNGVLLFSKRVYSEGYVLNKPTGKLDWISNILFSYEYNKPLGELSGQQLWKLNPWSGLSKSANRFLKQQGLIE